MELNFLQSFLFTPSFDFLSQFLKRLLKTQGPLNQLWSGWRCLCGEISMEEFVMVRKMAKWLSHSFDRTILTKTGASD